MEFREFKGNTRELETGKRNLRRTLKVIAEGRATEYYYFTALSALTGHNRLLPNLEVVYIDKINESQDDSHPPRLIEWIKEDKSKIQGYGQPGNEYEYYIVFDLDRSRTEMQKGKKVTYHYMKEQVESDSDIFLLNTNPCFELWLLLHYEDFCEKYLSDEEVLRNRKIKYIDNLDDSSTKYLTHLISEIFGINTKLRNQTTEEDILRRLRYKECFLDKLGFALENERSLCGSVIDLNVACSNIGFHINRILEST